MGSEEKVREGAEFSTPCLPHMVRERLCDDEMVKTCYHLEFLSLMEDITNTQENKNKQTKTTIVNYGNRSHLINHIQ